MKARPFKQSTGTAHPEPIYNDHVGEALELQARNRPPKPPVVLGPPPKLPRIPKPQRRKHKK
jgi:hypothetical protein